MKFGRNLARNQIPEWSSNYIDYKGLKRLIRADVGIANSEGEVDLAEFLFCLDRNLEVVDSFHKKKFIEASRRLKLLQDQYGISRLSEKSMDYIERHEIMSALLELRGLLRKLQWFGEVNMMGFVKITKKLDKKLPCSYIQQRYVMTKVNQKQFSTDFEILVKIAQINEWLHRVGEESKNTVYSYIHSEQNPNNDSTKNNEHLDFLFEDLDQATSNDDILLVKQNLESTLLQLESDEGQKFLMKLLQRAVSYQSRQSIKFLLHQIKSLQEPQDISQRNFLHRLVISIGRAESSNSKVNCKAQISITESTDNLQFITPALIPSSGPSFSKPKQKNMVHVNALPFEFFLENLMPHQRTSLISKDIYGRIPLHYAAQLDSAATSETITNFMQNWNLSDLGHENDNEEWEDNEGLTPLDLSVVGGHLPTTQVLLKYKMRHILSYSPTCMKTNDVKFNRLIVTATKFNYVSILKLLVENGVDINWQDDNGETAMHIAARFGHSECAKLLLMGNEDQMANPELTEKKFSWTPLHVACVDGHLSVVKLLIERNANLSKIDACGWTAKEHAALRGHMDIVQVLEAAIPETEQVFEETEKSDCKSTELISPILSSMETSRSININARSTEPIKTFGHRYLTDESLVLVNLGSMDTRKNTPAIRLDNIPIVDAHLTKLDTALSISISAEGAHGEPIVIDLPIDSNTLPEPILFTAVNPAKVKLYFDIIPTYSGNQKEKLGRGVALLSNNKQAIGVKRVDLKGDASVPILSTSLEVIGAVNFNCLVITPFSHPNMCITAKQTYWKEMSSTMVIGHRGLGKNITSNKSLQLGENTLQSFIAAANLGANYVEFDVQLTKDHVPVIYHDFLVSETGIDAPVHTLTLEQFLHVNENIPRALNLPTSPNEESKSMDSYVIRGKDRQRSKSLSHSIPECKMPERMKHTRDFKLKGYKANSRGNFIQAPFTTLEEMFLKLPEYIGFNIEMKYPMLHESESHEMDTYAVELNSFVDTVLSKTYDLGKKRKIIFSSFNPDVCLLLNFKQPSIPILFLTDAGKSPVGDIRASSLHEAIRFASRWNLLGIVSAAEPFCYCPRLVRVVKENGLVCVSYGTLNNDPLRVQKQVDEGIDAVIVDSVLKIRNGLTKNVSKQDCLIVS